MADVGISQNQTQNLAFLFTKKGSRTLSSVYIFMWNRNASAHRSTSSPVGRAFSGGSCPRKRRWTSLRRSSRPATSRLSRDPRTDPSTDPAVLLDGRESKHDRLLSRERESDHESHLLGLDYNRQWKSDEPTPLGKRQIMSNKTRKPKDRSIQPSRTLIKQDVVGSTHRHCILHTSVTPHTFSAGFFDGFVYDAICVCV